MGWRFTRRIRVIPGVSINLGRSGASVSIGPRGAKVTVGRRGVRGSVGIPGTGISYQTRTIPFPGRSTGVAGQSPSLSAVPADAEIPSVSEPTEMSSAGRTAAEVQTSTSFSRSSGSIPLLPERYKHASTRAPANGAAERAFRRGCETLAKQDELAAAVAFRLAEGVVDASVGAGFCALRAGRTREAIESLEFALAHQTELGKASDNEGVQLQMELALTEELTAKLGCDLEGVLLALAEAYQLDARPDSARRTLETLRELRPDDLMIRVSLSELLLEEAPNDANRCEAVLNLLDKPTPATSVGAAALLYRARALRALRREAEANDCLTTVAMWTAIPEDLRLVARYDRAMLLIDQGNPRGREELAGLTAAAPEFIAALQTDRA
jgi:tetratricopeptide (TPR) repeat protein